MDGKVAFILKGYPRLSETFISQEILGLEERGLDIEIVSLRHPTDPVQHPIHAGIRASVLYLPEYLHAEPGRVLRAWRVVQRWPTYAAARAVWWQDLKRDPTRNRVRRFGQALVLARELPAGVRHLHAHFLHTPASVARYASLLIGLPWTCSAHAKDIWTSPAWEKAEKLASCRWAVTCSAANRHHLEHLAPEGRVDLIYHGLDGARFPARNEPMAGRDGRVRDDAVVLLSVGRTVEKKGYDVLLAALGRLPAEIHWRFVHVGGGPLLAKLKRQALAQGLAGRIDWLGPKPQDEVLDRYRAADLFVLPSRIAHDGDRDGLPNVLLEALSQGLACVTTRNSAIPELIEDGVTGALVPPDDAPALAEALTALIGDPARRQALGAAGAARVREDFCFARSIDRLAAKFGLGA